MPVNRGTVTETVVRTGQDTPCSSWNDRPHSAHSSGKISVTYRVRKHRAVCVCGGERGRGEGRACVPPWKGTRTRTAVWPLQRAAGGCRPRLGEGRLTHHRLAAGALGFCGMCIYFFLCKTKLISKAKLPFTCLSKNPPAKVLLGPQIPRRPKTASGSVWTVCLAAANQTPGSTVGTGCMGQKVAADVQACGGHARGGKCVTLSTREGLTPPTAKHCAGPSACARCLNPPTCTSGEPQGRKCPPHTPGTVSAPAQHTSVGGTHGQA